MKAIIATLLLAALTGCSIMLTPNGRLTFLCESPPHEKGERPAFSLSRCDGKQPIRYTVYIKP